MTLPTLALAAQGTALAGTVLKWGFFVLGRNTVEQWNCYFLYEKQVSVIELTFSDSLNPHAPFIYLTLQHDIYINLQPLCS